MMRVNTAGASELSSNEISFYNKFLEDMNHAIAQNPHRLPVLFSRPSGVWREEGWIHVYITEQTGLDIDIMANFLYRYPPLQSWKWASETNVTARNTHKLLLRFRDATAAPVPVIAPAPVDSTKDLPPPIIKSAHSTLWTVSMTLLICLVLVAAGIGTYFILPPSDRIDL